MIMKISKEPIDHSGKRMRSCIGLFLTSCFSLGVIALAIHHHDASFQLKGCAICEAKTSLSSTPNMVKAGSPPAMAAVNYCSKEIYFSFFRIEFQHQTPFIVSLLPYPFLNKAPPFIS
jgi:hypothetical protein